MLHSFFFKPVIMLSCVVFFAGCVRTDRGLSVQPFFKRYSDAKLIFTAEIVEINPADEVLKIYSEFPKEDVKKVRLKVLSKWKGEMGGEVEVYAAWPIGDISRLAARKRATLLRGSKYVLYARVHNEKYVVQDYWGVRVEAPSRFPETIPLEMLKNGASMEEALSFLSEQERAAYDRFKRTGEVADVF